MGNCLFQSAKAEPVEKKKAEKEGVRVKIVLTKEQLQYLMVQIKDKSGGAKSLEDILEEIEGRERKNKVHSWKPSLESIIETPEVPEFDR